VPTWSSKIFRQGFSSWGLTLLRIHFTAEDLARVEVAKALDPLWETILGLHQLAAARVPAAFRPWRQRACTAAAAQLPRGLIAALNCVVPATGYIPDFLTPPESAAGLADGLEAVRGAPVERVHRELRLLAANPAARRPLPGWVRDLAAGDRRRRTELVRALRTVHDTLVAPDWTEAVAVVESARARCVRALGDGGVHALLGSLGPSVRWEPPILRTDYPVDQDLFLAGRGLRIVPSFFCWRTPVALADPELPPVLVCPVEHGAAAATVVPNALPELLGRTRARVLATLYQAATTGELARRLTVSPASASQHVHVLADANLVRSHRTGNQVLHTLTPLGAALLSGRLPTGSALT
jgi:DNA-binding transcriptional ArsR family regulator